MDYYSFADPEGWEAELAQLADRVVNHTPTT